MLMARRKPKRKRKDRNRFAMWVFRMKVRLVISLRPEARRSIPGQGEVGRKPNRGLLGVLGSHPLP